jgi:hypothetical protein
MRVRHNPYYPKNPLTQAVIAKENHYLVRYPRGRANGEPFWSNSAAFHPIEGRAAEADVTGPPVLI